MVCFAAQRTWQPFAHHTESTARGCTAAYKIADYQGRRAPLAGAAPHPWLGHAQGEPASGAVAHAPRPSFGRRDRSWKQPDSRGSVAQTIASGCTFDDAVDQQQKMLESGARLVPFFRSRLSGARLKEIFDPPIALFCAGFQGGGAAAIDPAGRVVGTRRPTVYGIAATERLSADLAHAGLTIVSGMARRHRHRGSPGGARHRRRHGGRTGMRSGPGSTRLRIASCPRRSPKRD